MEDGAGVTVVSSTGVSQARVGWLGTAYATSSSVLGLRSKPRAITIH